MSQGRLLRVLTAGLLMIALAGLVRRHSDRSPLPQRSDSRLTEIDSRIRAVRKLIAEQPEDARARWTLADLYQNVGRLEAAAEQLTELCTLQPDDPSPRLALGNTLLARQQLRNAERTFQETARRWPRNAEAWEGLAVAQFHERRYFESMQAAQRAVTLDEPEPNYRYILGCAALEYASQFPQPLLHSRELNRAGTSFLNVILVWKDNPDVLLRLGRTYMALRNRPGAIQYFKRVRTLVPNHGEAAYYLARAYISNGWSEQAREVVEAALVAHPNEAPLHDLLGELLQTSKDARATQRAFDAYGRAVQLEPRSATFLEHYGVACLRQGKLEAARRTFEAELDIASDRSFPLQQLAAIYTRLGQPDEATRYATAATKMVFNEQQLTRFETLCSQNPENPRLHLILADRYRDLGLFGPARDEYLLVLNHDPENKAAQQKLTKLLATNRKAR